jgi:hypothetical protein
MIVPIVLIKERSAEISAQRVRDLNDDSGKTTS